MKQFLANRIVTLRQKMASVGIDTFLVMIEENRFYLSGFTGEDTQFDESAGALIITNDALILATDSRYLIQAESEADGYHVICYKQGLVKELPSILKQLKTKRLGFEGIRLTYNQFLKIKKEIEISRLSVELIETSNMIEEQRLIKDDDEIAAIRKAVEIAESDFISFVRWLKPGLKEADAAWELEKRVRTSGAQALSFPIISAFGQNSALPHAIPGQKMLNTNIPLLFDWGAKLNRYCSDMTRTVIIDDADAFFNKIFTIVYDAQKKAIEAIKPGVSSKKIDDIARNHISDKGYNNCFGHGLGHGVGLAVHESPSISPVVEKEIILRENMVFTVEPGIYIPEWGGIRLENMVVVKRYGAEVLNHLKTPIHLTS